jgi:hypothetical protein
MREAVLAFLTDWVVSLMNRDIELKSLARVSTHDFTSYIW